MRKLRIALVHPFSWPEVRRGGERLLDDLASYLGGAGHSVDVITGTEGPTSVTHVGNVAVHRLHQAGRSSLPGRLFPPAAVFGTKAAAALALRRYDVVHTLTPASALAGRLTAQTTVFTPLGAPTREDFAEQPAHLQRSFLLAGRLSSAVTGLSAAAARRVADLTGRQTHVLYPGVRLDRFSPNLEPRLGPPRILFASDASQPRKGLHVLVAAFGAIREQWPDARLQLGGPGDHSWVLDGLGDRASPALAALDPLAVKGLGPMAEETMKAVDVLGVGDRDRLATRYQQATVTVLPSFNEAFGLVLTESLACGTPVVCSTDGGMTEIVDTPAIGRSAPYGDVDALAQAVAETIGLARDPRTPRRAVDHARQWGWQESAGPAHEALYASVVSGKT